MSATRLRRTLLVVLMLWPATVSLHAAPLFDPGLAADVFASALAFMAPRTLTAAPMSQLTLWGMDGVAALDRDLSVRVEGRQAVLRDGAKVVGRAPLPPEGDPTAWGDLAATLWVSAWTASPAVRRAGTEGVVGSFFDELFNHFDPYSRYVAPRDAIAESLARRGIAGIGVRLEGAPGQVRIATVRPDSPAALAGLVPGVRIITVDGLPAGKATATEMALWLAGPAGSKVTLKVRQARRRRIVRLERVRLAPHSVFVSRLGNVALLRIDQFDSGTANQLAEALAGADKLQGVILDLRGNRGGVLTQALESADILLSSGNIASAQGRARGASRVWRSNPGDQVSAAPMVVLVDGRTASAAEMLAASLQDNGRAVVVGSASFGKGLVQTIAPLPDGGALYLTWSRIIAPAGYPLQGLGVLPQICTSIGDAALDRQMADLADGHLEMRAALRRHDAARAPVPPPLALELRSPCPAAEGQPIDARIARRLLADPSLYRAALTDFAAVH